MYLLYYAYGVLLAGLTMDTLESCDTHASMSPVLLNDTECTQHAANRNRV